MIAWMHATDSMWWVQIIEPHLVSVGVCMYATILFWYQSYSCRKNDARVSTQIDFEHCYDSLCDQNLTGSSRISWYLLIN